MERELRAVLNAALEKAWQDAPTMCKVKLSPDVCTSLCYRPVTREELSRVLREECQTWCAENNVLQRDPEEGIAGLDRTKCLEALYERLDRECAVVH